jgi:hypothetical protein
MSCRLRCDLSQSTEMKLGLPVFSFIAVFICSVQVKAQYSKEDSIIYQNALTHTLAVYYDRLGDQSPIYNGSLYQGIDYTFQKGFPYFLLEKIGKGSIEYDNVFYPNLSLIYEDYRQNIVVIDQAFQLKLVNEKIRSFTIDDHHFEYMPLDSLNKGLPAVGFYEVLYAGKSKVLKYTTKKIREILSVSEGLRRYMDESNDYYIRSWNSYTIVNTRHEFLNFVSDHKKEVQRFIRKNDLSYKSDQDNTLKKAAAYYDQIANP